MKREVSNALAQRPFARHRLLMLGLPLMLAPFAIGSAEACTVGGAASASTSNSTVDCVGNTTNSGPSGVDGYGTLGDNNNIYNINAGATVAGDRFGISTRDNGIFHVDGTVTGDNISAIIGGNNLTVINSGMISSANRDGISASTLNLLGNTGTITGAVNGIVADSATINNTSTISGTGVAGVGILMTDPSDGTIDATGNTGAGIITGTAFGIKASPNANLTVSNGTGTISATGANGIGIDGEQNITINGNAGTISAVGTDGIAIQALNGTVTVNDNTNVIQGDKFVIDAKTINVNGNTNIIQGFAVGGVVVNASDAVTVTNNSGDILTNEVSGIAIKSANSDVTINGNSGTIEATGAGGTAIEALAGTATVNGNAGTITGDAFGIDAKTVNVTGNTGTITGAFSAASPPRSIPPRWRRPIALWPTSPAGYPRWCRAGSMAAR